MSTYKIKLNGYGVHAGVGKISKPTYTFWKDRQDVHYATDPNSSFDYASIGIETTSKLILGNFWDYCGTVSFSGLMLNTVEDTFLSVLDENDDIVYESTLRSLEESRASFPDFEALAENVDEFYLRADSPDASDLPSGHYLVWAREGRGKWFAADLNLPENTAFEIERLTFKSVDYEDNEYMVALQYDGEDLLNEGYDINWTDPDISFFQSTNKEGPARNWKFELY